MFTSELSVLRMERGGDGPVASKLSKGTTCGCLDVTGFPCRGFGAGGGFFLPFFTSDTSPMLSSSSDWAMSTDVRGDSACMSCECSKMDCRDVDEVSVLLLLSKCAPLVVCDAAVVCGGCPEWRGVGLPVRRRFLKLSTSREALLLPRVVFSALVRSSPLSPPCGSNDASVLEKGFAGTLPGDGVAWGLSGYGVEPGSISGAAMTSFPSICAFASLAVTESRA